jgi:hypothetical protein
MHGKGFPTTSLLLTISGHNWSSFHTSISHPSYRPSLWFLPYSIVHFLFCQLNYSAERFLHLFNWCRDYHHVIGTHSSSCLHLWIAFITLNAMMLNSNTLKYPICLSDFMFLGCCLFWHAWLSLVLDYA